MRVITLSTKEGKTRYMLLDNNNEPVQPVLHYLKFKDNSGASRNTLRSFSYHLKLFFEFLEQINKDYCDIGIDDMADFIRWLQNPHQDIKVSPIFPNQPISVFVKLKMVLTHS